MIMKQVQMVEITSFIEIAPKYFQHVLEAVKNEVRMHRILFVALISYFGRDP